MKIIALTSVIVACAWAAQAAADEYVQGYTRSDGTYVQGHYRSSPNSTRLDNYSTHGNINPYTGERGHRDPYQGYSDPSLHNTVPDYTGQRRAIEERNRLDW